MSYSYMAAVASQWRIPMALHLSGVTQMREAPNVRTSRSTLPFLYRKQDMWSSLIAVTEPVMPKDMSPLTNSVALGDQDRMVLICTYGLKDRDH